MESKLRTLSTVILTIGIIGAIVLFIAGMLLAGNFNTNATSGVMITTIIITLVVTFLEIVSTLVITFLLDAKAEQIKNEIKITEFCYSINNYLEMIAGKSSYHQTSSTTNSNNTFERSYGEKIDLDKAFPEQYEVGKTIIGD